MVLSWCSPGPDGRVYSLPRVVQRAREERQDTLPVHWFTCSDQAIHMPASPVGSQGLGKNSWRLQALPLDPAQGIEFLCSSTFVTNGYCHDFRGRRQSQTQPRRPCASLLSGLSSRVSPADAQKSPQPWFPMHPSCALLDRQHREGDWQLVFTGKKE